VDSRKRRVDMRKDEGLARRGSSRGEAMVKPPSAEGEPLYKGIRPIRRTSQPLERLVANSIRRSILAGHLRPGMPLRQDALAAQLGVSRLPVRAALTQLTAEGLVTVRPYAGATVTSLDKAEILELFALRELLEVYAIRQAVRSTSPDKIDALYELAERLDSARDGHAFLDHHRAFYETVYDKEANPRLFSFIQQLRDAMGVASLVRRKVHEVSAHTTLVGYIERKDEEGAAAWMRSHLDLLRDAMLQAGEEPLR
jgi:DNA-binding GntR family transcriptional regulator